MDYFVNCFIDIEVGKFVSKIFFKMICLLIFVFRVLFSSW